MKSFKNDNTYLKINYEMGAIWLSCLALLFLSFPSPFLILPLSVGTTLSSLSVMLPHPRNRFLPHILFCILLIISLFFTPSLPIGLPFSTLFSPLLLYFNAEEKPSYKEVFFLCLSVLLMYFLSFPPALLFLYVSLSLLALFLSSHILKESALQSRYASYYHTSKHEKIRLQNLYDSLILEQNHKIENAILSERNRISRDIHDSLGHLTSRGILQIGAMLVTEKEERKKEQLSLLKATLSKGMEEVRNSLHNFQNEALDLRTEVQKIISDFTFCELHFVYNSNSDFPLHFKYTILFILKEALTNITKHSNATKAEISFIETGETIYFKILDNGKPTSLLPSGMGLYSIRKRVEDLNGTIEISSENGFRIFITLKKGEKHENTGY